MQKPKPKSTTEAIKAEQARWAAALKKGIWRRPVAPVWRAKQ